MSAPRFTTWRGEWCKRCHRRNVIGFCVPDDLWAAVVQGRFNVVCPTCFDELAQEAAVRYRLRGTDLYPVSWSEWDECGSPAAITADPPMPPSERATREALAAAERHGVRSSWAEEQR